MGYYDGLYDEDPIIDASKLTPEALAESKRVAGTIDTGALANVGNAGSIQAAPSAASEAQRATGVSPSGAPTTGSASTSASSVPYDWRAMAEEMGRSRDADLASGLNFGSHFFGEGNPEMAAIIEQRRQRAMGLNGAEIQAMRERASRGINATMATGLRENRAIAGANGIHGGAAVGANSSIIARANESRGAAERDIALADMQRRGTELNGYESTLTGERAGLLGTGLGFANMGATDRSGAMQYGLGHDFMNSYAGAAGAAPNLDDGAWNAGSAFDKWHDGGFRPGQDPLADWLHNNVADPAKTAGFNSDKWTPQNVFGYQR